MPRIGRPPITTPATVLEHIRSHLQRHGKPPTIGELTREIGCCSTRTTRRYLQLLERDGRIERWNGSRGIRIIESTEIEDTPQDRKNMIPVTEIRGHESLRRGLREKLSDPNGLCTPPAILDLAAFRAKRAITLRREGWKFSKIGK